MNPNSNMQMPKFSRAGKRPPRGLMAGISVVALILFFLPLIVNFYTDFAWFGEVKFEKVFTTVIVYRVALFLVFGVLGALVVWLAGYIAFRLRPKSDSITHDPASPVVAYRKAIEQSLRKMLFWGPLVVGLGTGMIGQTSWRTVSLFFNRHSFGVKDPQFHLDYGFYAFTLPMIRLITETLSILLIISVIVTLIAHYLVGGIRAGSSVPKHKGRITKTARIQLGVMIGIWMLVKTAGYWLDRFDLLSKQHFLAQARTTFTGGNYTDINAVLPAKILLMIIGVVVAIAFFSTVVVKDLRIPALATVLMLVSAGVIGLAWPAAVEQFSVAPNRAEKESVYIGRNIEATRFAYGLDGDHVVYKGNWGAEGASDESVASDAATLSNIRLLDPQILSDTFTQRQQLKNFYGFPKKLNIDRYTVDGHLRDYVVAAREISPNSLSDNQRDWINRHTVYTHGNGLIAAPANKVDEVARDVGSTRGGLPVFIVSDLQALERSKENKDAEKLGIEVTQPRIYFGPVISSGPEDLDYAIVGGTPGGKALEYDTDGENFTYDGSGGVSLGNIFARSVFALQYQELNILLSDRIDSNSKILFNRDPRSRVEKVAPWLTTDSETYPAVIDGRIKWVVDGYTTLGSLPYAEQTALTDATRDALNRSGTNQRLVTDQIGYIRNSVKAVVDAYDGSVELYEFDENDPVLKAWEGVFPGTVRPKSEISDELLNHLRYPEDLFKVQREMIAKYHVDDAATFFKSDNFWSVPGDPTIEGIEDRLAQPPYYVVAADPETKEASFQLITPFRGFQRQYLAAHMSVSSDPDTYGRITVRQLRTDQQTLGPAQAQDTMISSDQIARDRTLWQATNDVINGNLLTLPVGGGEILYVEPVYTKRKGQNSAYPKLLRVLVYYKGSVGYAPTIAEALGQVGIDPREAADIKEAGDVAVKPGGEHHSTTENSSKENGTETPDTTTSASADPFTPSTTAPATAEPEPSNLSKDEALQRIDEALKNLKSKKDSSFEEYGKALDQLDKAVADYQRINGQTVSTPTVDSSPAMPEPADTQPNSEPAGATK